jgi:hypothetical protein
MMVFALVLGTVVFYILLFKIFCFRFLFIYLFLWDFNSILVFCRGTTSKPWLEALEANQTKGRIMDYQVG